MRRSIACRAGAVGAAIIGLGAAAALLGLAPQAAASSEKACGSIPGGVYQFIDERGTSCTAARKVARAAGSAPRGPGTKYKSKGFTCTGVLGTGGITTHYQYTCKAGAKLVSFMYTSG